MAISEEVTDCMLRLANNDPSAARALWKDYFEKLVRLAERHLRKAPLRIVDGEDIALSAMNSLCRGVREHRFPKLKDSDDLWKLLVTITARKVTAYQRKHFAKKRGCGRVRGESAFVGPDREDPRGSDQGIDAVLGKEPTPELAYIVAEDCRALVKRLDDESLRRVASLTLEGFDTDEIARQLGCVRRTVERKLQCIRKAWGDALTGGGVS